MTWEIGQQVRLRSGGPAMTIAQVREKDNDREGLHLTFLYCRWFVDGLLHDGQFNAATVEAIESPK